MNEPIFNLNRPYTIAIREQSLPPGVSNYKEFIFSRLAMYTGIDMLYSGPRECTPILGHGRDVQHPIESLFHAAA